MAERKIFKAVVAGFFCCALILWVLPYVWVPEATDEIIALLQRDGYGGVLQQSLAAYWIQLIIWLAVSWGLWSSRNWGRWSFIVVSCLSFAINPLYGVRVVLVPDGIFAYLFTLLNGALLVYVIDKRRWEKLSGQP